MDWLTTVKFKITKLKSHLLDEIELNFLKNFLEKNPKELK
jgi:hypothetical protein